MPERHPEIQFPVTRDSCPAEECHRLRLRLASGRPTCPGLGSQSSIRRALSAYQRSGCYCFDRMNKQLTSATLAAYDWALFVHILQTKPCALLLLLSNTT